MGIFRRLISIEGDVEPLVIRITTTSNNFTFYLPLIAYDGIEPSCNVDWDDGNTNLIQGSGDTNLYHTYATAGTYDIAISGTCPGLRVNNNISYRSLYKAVVSWGTTGLKDVNFYGCVNLTSIPTSGFVGLNNIRQWNNTFRGTGITSIPSGMFEYTTLASEFVDTFSYTQITTIPNNLFDNCTGVAQFSSTFNACTSLATIPNELFRYNTLVLSFSSCFRNCRALTNIPTFQYNTNVSIFRSVFQMSTTTNQSSQWDLDEALWNRSPTPLGTYAFRNCTGIGTNPSSTYSYADIPATWK